MKITTVVSSYSGWLVEKHWSFELTKGFNTFTGQMYDDILYCARYTSFIF
ncbi:MAG: hypothetical protein IPH96_11380 [Saprospiraceae bacterium]|nr:hypothetical protein [Saprospiraceae bacterium]